MFDLIDEMRMNEVRWQNGFNCHGPKAIEQPDHIKWYYGDCQKCKKAFSVKKLPKKKGGSYNRICTKCGDKFLN